MHDSWAKETPTSQSRSFWLPQICLPIFRLVPCTLRTSSLWRFESGSLSKLRAAMLANIPSYLLEFAASDWKATVQSNVDIQKRRVITSRIVIEWTTSIPLVHDQDNLDLVSVPVGPFVVAAIGLHLRSLQISSRNPPWDHLDGEGSQRVAVSDYVAVFILPVDRQARSAKYLFESINLAFQGW